MLNVNESATSIKPCYKMLRFAPEIWRYAESPYLCGVFFIVLDLRLTKDWLSGIDSLFLCSFFRIFEGHKTSINIMRTIMLTLLLSVAAISSFAQTITYRECTSQVEAINKMPLRMAHLVPVDSLGKYMYLEFAAPSLCDHSDVTADIDYRQATSFATLFYDEKGRVRKTIKWCSDGGDLNNVVYYDEQGNILYAVYASTSEKYGKLYSCNSQIHIDHSFSELDFREGFHLWINMTTENLASVYKADLKMPENGKSVTFSPVKAGDRAFLCTNRAYISPNGRLINEDDRMAGTYFGRRVVIEEMKGDWCKVRYSIVTDFDETVGYVRVEDLEIIK